MIGDNASRRVASPTLHATILFTISVFVALLIMSYLFRVEIVAKGVGRVVPLGRVQVVQPEYGGQVTAIHVRDGERVAKGQLLIELDSTNAQVELNKLEAEQLRLAVERHRIDTVLQTLMRPETLSKRDVGDIVASFAAESNRTEDGYFQEQRTLLETELSEFSDALAQADARILSILKSQEVTQAAIARVESALTTQRERLDVAENLLEKGTSSRATYLDVFDSFNGLEKEREIYLRELDQKIASEAESRADKSSIASSLRNQLQARKAELEAQQSVLEEELVTSRKQLKGAYLLSPVDGIIDQLSVFTIGGIVSAGQEVMRVVPENQSFEVEAFFPNTDVGFLDVGQKANIKLDAYPAERFGSLRGSVSSVSADAIEIAENTFGFVVRVAPKTPYLETPSSQYALQPGMTAVVDVITGNRRVISYFFAPIVKVVQESLGER